MIVRGSSAHAFVRGVGHTEYVKRMDRPIEVAALEATIAAAADAGIAPRAIDGIISYPGHVGEDVLIANLALPQVRFRATIDLGGASAVSGLRMAALAVLGGAADHVLLLRALKGSSGPRKTARPSFLPGQRLRGQLEHTSGWNSPAQRFAVLCQRYRVEHGLERRILGEVALAARDHANLNPGAQMYGRPLTMEQYLNGRPIGDPYLLFDCCLETDGACAVIVSAAPGEDRKRAVRILAVGEAHGASPHDITNRDPFLSIGLTGAARQVWEASGMGPDDMDAVMIYDCFTFEVIHQLEEAGFAPPGHGSDLVADGAIRLGGRLPVNTHGGLLSEGHLAGINHIVEAARQIRGECGPRQLSGAAHVAVSGWGQLGDGSFAILGGIDA